MGLELTPEQEMVIHHPLGENAKVLAVAGSGKTTTMVHRIKYLVEEMGVSASSIQVLMYNRLASIDFSYKLAKAGFSSEKMPKVNTFHSFGKRFMDQLVKAGLEPAPADLWIGDKGELSQHHLTKTIGKLRKEGRIPADADVDQTRADMAIGLWKNSLITPENAGYIDNIYFPLIYQEYEEARNKAKAMTYDDMVMACVLRLESDERIRERFCSSYKHIIVDEYQDVNYGQQRLVELLTGNGTDIMVVGDDDQTIYEWRGARPSYILRDFEAAFPGKPCREYRLSHTFRFGPVLAQTAANVISLNQVRKAKDLISDQPKSETWIELFIDRVDEGTDVSKEIVNRIIELVSRDMEPVVAVDEEPLSEDWSLEIEAKEEAPGLEEQSLKGVNTIVLCRTYEQLGGLEAELLVRELPYRVVGRPPFFERNEVEAILTYLELGMRLEEPLDKKTKEKVLRILNVPNRRISRKVVEDHLSNNSEEVSVRVALRSLCEGDSPPLYSRENVENMELMIHHLGLANSMVVKGEKAATILERLTKDLKLSAHYESYFGEGIDSKERIAAIAGISEYAKKSGLGAKEFLTHIHGLDTTRGLPEELQLVLTTIYRTKGLEFDYVVLPYCVEGRLPCVGTNDDAFRRIFDKSGKIKNPPQTEAMENERRLFYVALTRARKGVIIGSVDKCNTGNQGPGQNITMSRFIKEMRLAETKDVMGAMTQYIIKQNPDSERRLLAAAMRHGGDKNLIHNLCYGYLMPLQEVAIAEKILRAVEGTKEIKRTADNTPTHGRKEKIRPLPGPTGPNPWITKR